MRSNLTVTPPSLMLAECDTPEFRFAPIALTRGCRYPFTLSDESCLIASSTGFCESAGTAHSNKAAKLNTAPFFRESILFNIIVFPLYI